MTTEFYTYNAVGHTTALADVAGGVRQTNAYDAFGNRLVAAGPSTNNRLANTKERDASLALDNHGFRYYDPATGRYLTRDPAGYVDGPNLYRHVHNNPINHIDPLGLSSWNPYSPEFAPYQWLMPSSQPGNLRNGGAGGGLAGRRTAAISEVLPEDQAREVRADRSRARQVQQRGIDTVRTVPLVVAETVTPDPTVMGDGVGIMYGAATTPGLSAGQRARVGGLGAAVMVGGALDTVDLVPDPSDAAQRAALDGMTDAARRRLEATRLPVQGRPVHAAPDHDATAYNTARGLEADPTRADVRFNQGLRDAEGNRVRGYNPDVQSLRVGPDGHIVRDVIEVRSRTQSRTFMDNKINKMKEALGDQAGDVRWVQRQRDARRQD